MTSISKIQIRSGVSGYSLLKFVQFKEISERKCPRTATEENHFFNFAQK